MKNIKNTFLVSALSLGLIVGAVSVASAATSTDYQQKMAEWINNDPQPMVMNANSGATPVTTTVATPASTLVPAPTATLASTPVTVPAKTVTPVPVTTVQLNQYHYNDGHSNMNPQQHQQLHNSMNGNGHNTNHNENHNANMSGNHMSGSQSGHQ